MPSGQRFITGVTHSLKRRSVVRRVRMPKPNTALGWCIRIANKPSEVNFNHSDTDKI